MQAWLKVMHRWTGQDRTTVGTRTASGATANRSCAPRTSRAISRSSILPAHIAARRSSRSLAPQRSMRACRGGVGARRCASSCGCRRSKRHPRSRKSVSHGSPWDARAVYACGQISSRRAGARWRPLSVAGFAHGRSLGAQCGPSRPSRDQASTRQPTRLRAATRPRQAGLPAVPRSRSRSPGQAWGRAAARPHRPPRRACASVGSAA